MINYEQKIFLNAIIISILALIFFGEIFYDFKNQILLFLLPIIWPGIAHGSLDLEIAINRGWVKKFNHKVLFFFTYLSIIIVFFTLWIIFPNIVFLVFLILSAIHFGISDKVSKMKYAGILEILIRASIVIVLPLKFYPEVTSKVFVFLGLNYNALSTIQFLNDLLFYLLILILFIWLFLRNESKKLKLNILIEFLLIGFCFIYFQPIISFLIYFCFLHSIRHLNEEKKYLRLCYKSLFKKTLPFTLIPLLVLIIFFLNIDIKNEEHIYYAALGLSSLTIPHVVLINYIKN